MTCVTGVSAPGKCSLVNEILYKRLARDLNRARLIPGKHKGLEGEEQLDKVINIDQSLHRKDAPLESRHLYRCIRYDPGAFRAATADAKARGYKKGRFSFNVKGGRCEACGGRRNFKNRNALFAGCVRTL